MSLIETAGQDLWDLHRRFIARSGIAPASVEDRRFLTLALAGEVGEVANLVKKEWRGDKINGEALCDELSDVFAYWAVLVRCSGFSVIEVVERSCTKAAVRLSEIEAAR